MQLKKDLPYMSHSVNSCLRWRIGQQYNSKVQVVFAQFSKNFQYIACVLLPNKIRLIRIRSQKTMTTFKFKENQDISTQIFDIHNHKVFTSCSSEKKIRTWVPSRGKFTRQVSAYASNQTELACAPNNHSVAYALNFLIIQNNLLTSKTWKMYDINKDFGSLLYSFDSKNLLAQDQSSKISIWDLKQKSIYKTLQPYKNNHQFTKYNLKYSEEGELIYSIASQVLADGCEITSISIIAAGSYQQIAIIDLPKAICQFYYSLDGQFYITKTEFELTMYTKKGLIKKECNLPESTIGIVTSQNKFTSFGQLIQLSKRFHIIEIIQDIIIL